MYNNVYEVFHGLQRCRLISSDPIGLVVAFDCTKNHSHADWDANGPHWIYGIKSL